MVLLAMSSCMGIKNYNLAKLRKIHFCRKIKFTRFTIHHLHDKAVLAHFHKYNFYQNVQLTDGKKPRKIIMLLQVTFSLKA